MRLSHICPTPNEEIPPVDGWTTFLAWQGWPALGTLLALLAMVGVVIAVVQLWETVNQRPKWGFAIHVEGHGIVVDGIVSRRFTMRTIGSDVMYEVDVYSRGIKPLSSSDSFRSVMTATSDPFIVDFQWPEGQPPEEAWVGVTWVQPRASTFRPRGARISVRVPGVESLQEWKNYRFPRFHASRGRWVALKKRPKIGPEQYT